MSLHEIHSDLCELQRSLSPDDTDGDSSVESDDVVDSHYPVKPRRSIRIVDREDITEFDKLDNVSFEIEESMKIIKQLFVSNSALFEAENRREDLETMAQVVYTSTLLFFLNQSMNFHFWYIEGLCESSAERQIDLAGMRDWTRTLSAAFTRSFATMS